MLYEEQYALAPILCLQCATYFAPGEVGVDACPECGANTDVKTYEEWFRHAFYAVRYGYQYRNYRESSTSLSDTQTRPFLPPLDEVFTFMGIAAIGGINGSASIAVSRKAIHRILANWNSISDANEQIVFSDPEIERFIEFIAGYYEDLYGVQDGSEPSTATATLKPGARKMPDRSPIPQGTSNEDTSNEDTQTRTRRQSALPSPIPLWSKLRA